MLRQWLLVIPFFFAACGSDKNDPSNSSGNISEASSAVPAGDFYKRFRGTIGGKPVVAQLHRWGNKLEGSYQYTSIGQVIPLSYTSGTASNGQYLLTERMPAGQGNDAQWNILFRGNTAIGKRSSSDGLAELQINLAEDYPAGSQKLQAFYLADSTVLMPDSPASPKAVTTFRYILPTANGKGFLYDVLCKELYPRYNSNEDLIAALKAENAAYFEVYRKEHAALIKEFGKEEDLFSFNCTSDDMIRVVYNDDNWLVTETLNASYTGGAHGNYGATYANIDLLQQRVWKVLDILTDTAALRPMLNDAAINYFQLKPGQNMEARVLVDEVPPTDNIFLTATGLTFVYNPYEIASYADGEVALFLSYRKLMPYLTPAFKTRMKLSERAGVALLGSLH